MITKITHLTLYVLDQNKAHDVYVNKLGCKVNTDMTMENGFRWLTVNPPDQPDLEIVLAEPQVPMFEESLVETVRGLLQKNAMGGGVWATDDCEKTYEALKAKGVEFLKPPTKEFYGIEALFRDGCGNWFSLTQRLDGES
ncbi:MAG TPA: VOC family protein [Anaerolineae bacterium]|jgi:catechol 2,3-dioxygenase-like lactoylglutathione lyase family enzyme